MYLKGNYDDLGSFVYIFKITPLILILIFSYLNKILLILIIKMEDKFKNQL